MNEFSKRAAKQLKEQQDKNDHIIWNSIMEKLRDGNIK